MKAIVRMGLIPNNIKLQGGTTDIWGVFYSNEITSQSGVLPYCEFDRIIEDIQSGSPNYRFYVGNVDSKAMPISSSSLQSWCKLMNFNLLPSWAVPVDANDDSLLAFISSPQVYPFEAPLICGYIIFNGQASATYHPLNLQTKRVCEADKYVDFSGYFRYILTFDDNTLIYMNYPDAVQYDVQKNSQIVLDGGTVIWCTTDSDSELSNRITCPFCNKILDVPASGPMTCSDSFCKSLLAPRLSRFCNILDLPMLSKDAIDGYIENEDLTIFPDILLLPEYKDLSITKSLWEIIFAYMSADVGLNKEWLIKLCNKCNNSYETVKYYFENPMRLRTDLDLTASPRLIKWLQEPRNLVELDTIIQSSQISIATESKLVRFDADPILRNRTIYITGKFAHGPQDDIIAILNSYAATVVTEFDEYVQCVIVGDLKEDINGTAILAARDLHIPVFDESTFFAKYQIDEDIEKYVM